METTSAVAGGRGGSSALPPGGDGQGDGHDDQGEALTPEELAAQWEEEKPPGAGPLANAASSLVVLAVGIGALALSVSMGLGSPEKPEPGLWPFLTSCVMVALAIFQLVW